ncbi:hypothetical protein [Carboxylicivirga taeanensis]|uniref:hypothetical protein n=1 Tax=Carboxylicivirga taeanensis TaxID=1416875 RepID=UPI003F6E2B39
MVESTNIDKLKDFAKRSGRQIVLKEEQYTLPAYRKIPHFKRTVYIPYDEHKQLFYVLFSDYYNGISGPNIFCGIYFKTAIPKATQLNFRPKNIIDKLNPFLAAKVLKTNSRFFDSKVVTSGNNASSVRHYFSNSVLQRMMIENLSTDMFMNFSLNETNVDFVPELKEVSHFALLNPQEWVMDPQTIERWFTSMQRIHSYLRNTTY